MSTQQVQVTWEDARSLAYSIARSRYNHEDAEDLAQDVCMSLLSAETFGRGLVATRTYARMMNAAKKGDARRLAEDLYSHEPQHVLDPQTVAELESALSKLTDPQRQVIEAVVMRGMTERDAARVMRVTQQAVHQMLDRALRALTKVLSSS